MEQSAIGSHSVFADVLVEEAPDALLAVALDGKILSWNRGARAIFGFEATEAIGHPVQRLIVPAERRADADRALLVAIEQGTSAEEAVRRKKDGTLVRVDVTMRRVDRVGADPFVAVNGKLFVEFQQLDASSAKKYQGTGLGLALTKRIAEAHGGRVIVRSELGKGVSRRIRSARASW